MKVNSTFHVLCFLVILTILSMSFASIAQETSDAALAVVDAKNDVKEPFGWLGGSFLMASGLGCLGGSIVILASQAVSPIPPTHRLVGKSSEYVSFYMNTYQSEIRRKRLIYTSVGCLGGTFVAAIIWAPYYNTLY